MVRGDGKNLLDAEETYVPIKELKTQDGKKRWHPEITHRLKKYCLRKHFHNLKVKNKQITKKGMKIH